jgi:hypothetical protein
LIRRSLASAATTFGKPFGHVLFVVQDLALQVVQFQKIPVDDPQESDAGPDQRIGDHRTQGTAAAQQNP